MVEEPVRTLTVLGCDGSYPGPGGAASGYLLAAGSTRVLLDAGPGTFAALQLVCDPASLTGVVLSHEHPDHWTDLESLAVFLRYGRRGGPAVGGPLPVLAPPGLRARSFFAGAEDLLGWQETEPSAVCAVGELELRFTATEHGPPTLAVRADHRPPGGPAGSFAYSADTGPGWSVEELGPGIGTFLCEATYTRELEGSLPHLSGRQAGAMARAAGVGRLVVTHRWPTVSAEELAGEASTALGAPVVTATRGATLPW